MTRTELKVCLAIAQSDQDLSGYDDAILFGFGCPDFEPVTVAPQVVAKCIRWQCERFDGKFDWEQFNLDAPHYVRNVNLSTFDGLSLRALQETLAAVIGAKLAQ